MINSSVFSSNVAVVCKPTTLDPWLFKCLLIHQLLKTKGKEAVPEFCLCIATDDSMAFRRSQPFLNLLGSSLRLDDRHEGLAAHVFF